MKKQLAVLLIKIGLIGLPFICFSLICALFPWYYMDGEFAWWSQQKEYLTSETAPDAKVLILGDSRAKCGLQPLLMADGVYNMALGGGTSIEMYYSLKNYLKAHKSAPQTVVIVFGDFHYWFIDCFWSRAMYFHYFNTEEQIEIFETASRLNNEEIVKDGHIFDVMCYEYYMLNKYAAAVKKAVSGKENRYTYNTATFDAAKEARGYTDFGFGKAVSANRAHGINSFEYNKLLDCYLDKLITLGLESGIDVIVEQAPVNEATFNNMQNTYLAKYTAYMESVQTRYPQCAVNTQAYYYENDCFADPGHLNIAGSKKYTKEILDKYPIVFGDM